MSGGSPTAARPDPTIRHNPAGGQVRVAVRHHVDHATVRQADRCLLREVDPLRVGTLDDERRAAGRGVGFEQPDPPLVARLHEQ